MRDTILTLQRRRCLLYVDLEEAPKWIANCWWNGT